ncbi:MAG: serine hydrolase domain-containing protein [bacterium]
MQRLNPMIDVNRYVQELIKNNNQSSFKELNGLVNPALYRTSTVNLNAINEKNRLVFRDELFKNLEIPKEIHRLISGRKISPGMIVSMGTQHFNNVYISGNSSEYALLKDKKIEKESTIEEDTIFDISEVSMIFTIILLYHLNEKGMLDIDEPVRKYCSHYKHLEETTTRQLMKFQKHLYFHEHILTKVSAENAEKIMRKVLDRTNYKESDPYNSLVAVVLKDIIEASSNEKFNDLVEEIILKPTKMNNTYLDVPKDLESKVASNNFYNFVTQKGDIYEDRSISPGTSVDIIARSFKEKQNNAPGHDGYFSTAEDMRLLSLALINGDLIKSESVLDISDNVEPVLNFDEWNRPIEKKILGTLCHLKDPYNRNSISYLASGKTFKLSGKTGIELVIDPLNKSYVFIASNRYHNRIVEIPKSYMEKNKIGSSYEGMIISKNFQEEINHLAAMAMEQALLYNFIEKVNTPSEVSVRVKKA